MKKCLSLEEKIRLMLKAALDDRDKVGLKKNLLADKLTGLLEKRRKTKINKHKRKKRMKQIRRKKRLRYESWPSRRGRLI